MSEKIKKAKEQMLKEYLSSQLIYVEYTSYIENKVKNILIENGIKYQSLSSRVKSYDSLENKLTEKIINGVCKDIKKINDLSGVRVIFYDEEELKKINSIIYEEFNVKSYRPSEDIMEYDGVNITVSLKKDFNKFKGLLCEIQLTTLLSHAMNEFGHDIIYKDIDELQSKDGKEYDKIKNTFENVRKDILKIMASLEFINRRVYSIKTGAKNIEILLGEDFNERLKSVKSLNELEEIINKMIEVIPLVNEYEEKYKKIYDSGIIYSIVKKFGELPAESAKLLNYDTYEYKYGKLLEFLQSYKYLWIDDFKSIISILYMISVDNNIIEKFDKFIENLVISDKVDSNRGFANYNIHEIVYSTIFDKDLDDYVRIKLAEYFCDINYNYCEEVGMNKISFISNNVNPNENYKDKIYKAIKVIFDIFFTRHSKNALHALISINCDLERNTDIFDYNPIYELFYNNYDDIDVYSQNELYKSVSAWKNTKLENSKFYKKLKKDKIQNIYAMLFNFFIDEIPGAKYSEKEEFRTNYLNEYIKNFSDGNVKEIIAILNTMDNEDINNLNVYNAGRFLIDIGSLEKYGKKIIEIKWNEFILLGIIKQDKSYQFTIDNEIKAEKIIEAMLRAGNIDLNIINKLIAFSEKTKSENLEIRIVKLIFNNIDLVINKEHKDYALNIIKKYNSITKGIMGEILYNPHTEKKIIEEYNYTEICILLENFRYSEFNRLDEFFLNDLFEKYPEDLRNLLKQRIKDNPNSNLYNSYSHINLTDSSNYNEEKYNNLKLCMELLKANDYYKISNYIHYLIGKYNDELGGDILKYLKENDNYDSYTKVIDLCRLFDASLSCWKIYEYIISKIDSNDKLLNEIDCLLFNTGVVTGEYGIANSFNEKYMFFKGLKSKNKKVKEFVNKEIVRFKILYQDEKNKRDKDRIIKETKYNLENKNTDEN